MSLIIPVWVDEGAIEVLWYSDFNDLEDLISWWENKESIDIYKYKTDLDAAKAILSNGIIIQARTHKEQNFFYKIRVDEKPLILMIDTDYTSYLSFDGKKYFHKEKLNYSAPPPSI